MHKYDFQLSSKPYWSVILDELWNDRNHMREDTRIRAFYQSIKLMFVPEHNKRRGLGFEQRLVSMRMKLKKVEPITNKKKYDFVVRELNEHFNHINKAVEEDIEAYANKCKILSFKPSMFEQPDYFRFDFHFAKRGKMRFDKEAVLFKENKESGWVVGDTFEDRNRQFEPMISKPDYGYEEGFDVEATLLYLLERALKCTHNSQFATIWDRRSSDAVKALKSALKKLPRELEVKYNEGAELKYYKTKKVFNDFK